MSATDEKAMTILRVLKRSEVGLTASELEDATYIPQTTIRTRLRQMLAAGLIEKVPAGGGGRAYWKSPTPQEQSAA